MSLAEARIIEETTFCVFSAFERIAGRHTDVSVSAVSPSIKIKLVAALTERLHSDEAEISKLLKIRRIDLGSLLGQTRVHEHQIIGCRRCHCVEWPSFVVRKRSCGFHQLREKLTLLGAQVVDHVVACPKEREARFI